MTCLEAWKQVNGSLMGNQHDACPACGENSLPTKKPSSRGASVSRIEELWFMDRKEPTPLNSPSSGCSPLGLLGTIPVNFWQGLEQGGPLEEFPLPDTSETIGQSDWPLASGWLSVLGRPLVTCLFSRDWQNREAGLKRFAREVANALADTESLNKERLIRTTSDVLARMIDDKVFKVYLAAVRCLRTLLVHLTLESKAEATLLQTCLRPIVRGILLKVSDGNKRMAELGLAMILEMSKGTLGEMGVGKYITGTTEVHQNVAGLEFVLSVVLEKRQELNGSPVAPRHHKISWQAIVGRLITLESLVEQAPHNFLPPSMEYDDLGSSFSRSLELSFSHLTSTHINVSRHARNIFLSLARLSFNPEELTIRDEICQLIGELDPTLQARIKKRLLAGLQSGGHRLDQYHLVDKMLEEGRLRRRKHCSLSPLRKISTSSVSNCQVSTRHSSVIALANQSRATSYSPTRHDCKKRTRIHKGQDLNHLKGPDQGCHHGGKGKLLLRKTKKQAKMKQKMRLGVRSVRGDIKINGLKRSSASFDQGAKIHTTMGHNNIDVADPSTSDAEFRKGSSSGLEFQVSL